MRAYKSNVHVLYESTSHCVLCKILWVWYIFPVKIKWSLCCCGEFKGQLWCNGENTSLSRWRHRYVYHNSSVFERKGRQISAAWERDSNTTPVVKCDRELNQPPQQASNSKGSWVAGGSLGRCSSSELDQYGCSFISFHTNNVMYTGGAYSVQS